MKWDLVHGDDVTEREDTGETEKTNKQTSKQQHFTKEGVTRSNTNKFSKAEQHVTAHSSTNTMVL